MNSQLLELQKEKIRLKNLLKESLEDTLFEIESKLRPESKFFDEVIHMRIRLNQFEREIRLGTISTNEKNIRLNEMHYSAISLINAITTNDFKIVDSTKVSNINTTTVINSKKSKFYQQRILIFSTVLFLLIATGSIIWKEIFLVDQQNAYLNQEKVENNIKVNDHDGDTEKYFLINKNLQKLTIKFDMYKVPDEIIVFCGKSNEKGKVLSGKIAGSGIMSFNSRLCNNSEFITIKVLSAQHSTWSYELIWTEI